MPNLHYRRLARSSGLLSYTLAVGCVAAPPLGDDAETGTPSSGEVPSTTSTSTASGSSGESTLNPCGGEQEERLAVLVSLGGARPEQLFDDSRRLVGSYDVWVLRARQTQTFSDDPHCPSSLFEGARVLMIASP
jgi:hypothetical protein